MSNLYVKRDGLDKDIYHLYLELPSTGYYWHVAAIFVDIFCDAFEITAGELDEITTELSPAPFRFLKSERVREVWG